MWTGVSWMRLVSNGRKAIKGQTIVRRIEQKRKVFFHSRANSYLNENFFCYRHCPASFLHQIIHKASQLEILYLVPVSYIQLVIIKSGLSKQCFR